MLKSHLAGMLEKQREDRAEERQIAKEAREAAKIVGQKIVRDSDGTTWRVGVNSAKEEKGERILATEQEIKDYNREEASKQRKDSLEALELLGKEREAADYDADKDLDRRYREAQIGQIGDSSKRGWASLDLQRKEYAARAAGLGGYGRGSSRGLEGELTDVGPGRAAADWIKDNQHIIGNYLKPDPITGKTSLNPNELMRVVSTAIQTAAERGKDIDQTVVGALVHFPQFKDLKNKQSTR